MKRVVAGRRSQKITLYKPVIGKTPSGAVIKNQLEKVASPWASVMVKNTGEQEFGEALQGTIVYSIVIAWRDIGKDWVVSWRGQLLRVINVDDSDPQRRQKKFSAESENTIKELEFIDNSIVDGAIETLDEAVNEPW